MLQLPRLRSRISDNMRGCEGSVMLAIEIRVAANLLYAPVDSLAGKEYPIASNGLNGPLKQPYMNGFKSILGTWNHTCEIELGTRRDGRIARRRRLRIRINH